jgi:hypothetical protein
VNAEPGPVSDHGLQPLRGLKVRQQINLYQEVRVPRVPFSARFMILYVAALAASLAVVQMLLQSSLAGARAQMSRAAEQLAADTRTLSTLQEEAGTPGSRMEQKQALARTRARIEEARQILVLLLAPQEGSRTTPAQVLRALAGAQQEGVWLRHVRTDRAAARVLIEGGTLQAALLPRYMAALTTRPPFTEALFRAFQASPAATVSRQERTPGSAPAGPGPRYLEFRLASGLTPEEVGRWSAEKP